MDRDPHSETAPTGQNEAVASLGNRHQRRALKARVRKFQREYVRALAIGEAKKKAKEQAS